MTEEGRTNRAGTMWDWPVAVILIGLLLLLFAGGARVGAVLLLVFGVVALLIRRGAFTPRR